MCIPAVTYTFCSCFRPPEKLPQPPVLRAVVIWPEDARAYGLYPYGTGRSMQRGAAPLCTFIEYELIQISAFLILDKSIAECLFFRSPQIPEIRSKLPPKERTREEAVACPLMKEGTQRLTKPNGERLTALGPLTAQSGTGF